MNKQERMLVELLGDRPAIVVAHPDDETLWAGGLLSMTSELSWMAICGSIPRLDPIRAWHWQDACYGLGVYGTYLWPVIETPPNHDLNLVPPIPANASCVLTHGRDGEYGHRHHKQIHHWVNEVFDGPIINFGGDISVRLDREASEAKKSALKTYRHETVYNGQKMKKWEALVNRYYQTGLLSFEVERFTVLDEGL